MDEIKCLELTCNECAETGIIPFDSACNVCVQTETWSCCDPIHAVVDHCIVCTYAICAVHRYNGAQGPVCKDGVIWCKPLKNQA
jgi:hypothetical protein